MKLYKTVQNIIILDLLNLFIEIIFKKFLLWIEYIFKT